MQKTNIYFSGAAPKKKKLNIINEEKNLPVLFNKKRKQIVIKPLTYVRSDTGKTRHFTPAVQE